VEVVWALAANLAVVGQLKKAVLAGNGPEAKFVK
jgi:hypothetical protein